MTCKVEGCEKKAHARELCTMHYQRQKRKGKTGPAVSLIAPEGAHEAFLHLVDEGVSECVEWPFGKDGYGYGCTTHNGKKERAHRAQWERKNRRNIPDGMVVRHTCDNPSCVNPSHLILGTQSENIADQEIHGRKAKGVQKGGAKLTDEIVKVARQRVASGETVKSLAAEYGVHEGTMSQACRRDTWRHVP